MSCQRHHKNNNNSDYSDYFDRVIIDYLHSGGHTNSSQELAIQIEHKE